MSPTRTITDEELLQLPEDGLKYEVVDGQLVGTPYGGMHHAIVVAHLMCAIGSFAETRDLGMTLASNLLYVLPSGNRRGADVSFIAALRAAALPRDTVFPQLAPDLAVEVLSPFDSARRVLDRLGEFLEAGTRLFWLIEPEQRQAGVYRGITKVHHIAATGALDGEDVLPGFRLPLVELFD